MLTKTIFCDKLFLYMGVVMKQTPNKINNNIDNQKILNSAKKILANHKYAFEVLSDVEN